VRAPLAAPQATPIIRIVDDEVLAQEEAERAQWQATQAAAAQAAQAAQTEQAVRIAQGARAATAAMPAMESAGPLFVSPRAEAPQQRTLFAAQEPEFEEEEEVSGGRALFNRLANVGKSITGVARTPSAAPRVTSAAPVERKAEVRETTPHAGDEDEMYDIPAFLRRQAN
jgi:hypothetical protein